MAVEQKARFIRDYWPNYRRRLLPLIMAVHLTIVAIAAIMALLIGIAQLNSIGFWMTILFATAMSLTINYFLFRIITEPLEMLTSAISHIAGEQNAAAAPNTNSVRYEKEGFNLLLQALYSLAANQPTESSEEGDSDKSAATQGMIAALNATPTGIVFMDKSGNITYANKSAPVRLLNNGTLALELIFDVDEPFENWRTNLGETSLQAQKTWTRVANKLTGEEDRKIFDIVASYEQGSDVEIVLTFFERTDDYAPEDNDLDFIAFAAHELRGPITVIRGYLDTLEDELSDRLKNDETILFNRLTVSANRLSGYINNILNAAKYDRRHLRIHLNEESLTDIYDSIKDDMSLRAVAQNRILQVEIPADLPKIGADRSGISEVIGNLVDNAIKYSHDGGVVSVTARPIGDTVEISIIDRGLGMPANVMSNLFHKFYRSHRSRETVAGTGIGLYICKIIVESHGGKISVRSVEGEGSTFTFTLPTYASIADKLESGDNANANLVQHQEGWIKNHGAMRG